MTGSPRTIPQIRARIVEIANELDVLNLRIHKRRALAQELVDLAEETRRRSPVRRGPDKHERLTAAQTQAIRQYAQTHPDAHQVEIGLVFNVNPGRISEALAGKRGAA
jgi:predicted nucleic acid-binding protein